MRLRTFTAPDMPSAMQQVREALGEDAIILSSQTHKGKGVSVTAAVEPSSSDDSYESGDLAPHTHKPTASAKRLAGLTDNEPLRFQIQEILRFHNIPELFIAKIMNADHDAWTSDGRHCLEKLLAAYFRFEPLHFSSPIRGEGIMLIGPPGIGKTSTIARIAARLAMDKRQPLVITTDTKRAGGVEQLQAFTDIMDIPLAVASTPAELRKLLKGAGKDILIDTAGCNPYNKTELEELAEYAEQTNIEPVLALPAGGDSLEGIDAVEAFMALPIRRMLITRVDTARRFGGIVAAAAAHKLTFCNASTSSSITDPLLPVDEALLAQLLLRYQSG